MEKKPDFVMSSFFTHKKLTDLLELHLIFEKKNTISKLYTVQQRLKIGRDNYIYLCQV